MVYLHTSITSCVTVATGSLFGIIAATAVSYRAVALSAVQRDGDRTVVTVVVHVRTDLLVVLTRLYQVR